MENRLKKAGILFIVLMAMMISMAGCSESEEPATVRIAIPQSYHVQNLESNYYLNWLEEKCGIQIVPIEINQPRCDEYLKYLAESEVDIDIVFFGEDFLPTKETIQKLADMDVIQTFEDGKCYYENYGDEKTIECGQVLWINIEWLSKLGLQVPKTTEELKNVLSAFAAKDPNGNGKKDEIPLIGTTEAYAQNPVEYMMNSFVYNDPYHMRFYKKDNIEFFAPESKEFKEGLDYCSELYREKMLDERTFSYSLQQLRELINQPDSMVGAFCTDSIENVIYQGNPEIVAKYICVPPLMGPEGQRNSLFVTKEPTIAAIVPAKSKEKENAVRLLDFMMTEEASLISRFGEEGVDWEYSDGQDVSIYGGRAKIVTKKYIWNIPQNKHLNGIGPMKVPEEYLEGVTWNGVNSDLEYIDARAKMNYQSFFPEEISEHPVDEKMETKLNETILEWIRGENQNEEMLSWDYLYDACYSAGTSDGVRK